MLRGEILVTDNDAEKPRTLMKARAKPPPAARRRLFEGDHMMARERRFIMSFR